MIVTARFGLIEDDLEVGHYVRTTTGAVWQVEDITRGQSPDNVDLLAVLASALNCPGVTVDGKLRLRAVDVHEVPLDVEVRRLPQATQVL